MNIKMFHGNNLRHELLLTMKNQIRECIWKLYVNWCQIILSKAQISKIIQSGDF